MDYGPAHALETSELDLRRQMGLSAGGFHLPFAAHSGAHEE